MSKKSESEKLQDNLEPLPSPEETMYAIHSDVAYEKALEYGWDVVLPQKNQLFPDFDSHIDYAELRKMLLVLQRFYEAFIVRETKSPSGKPGHYHVVIQMNEDLTDLERVLLQAVLGSDRKRELLAWVRIKIHDPIPTLFFETPKLNLGGFHGT